MPKTTIHNGIIIQILRILFPTKQNTLSLFLKNTQATMSFIENGKTDITITQLEQICDFFEITKEQFFALKDFINKL